ncbi:MAG: hypothetical protein WCO56_09200 [Verrucomicrobiota bacterium]
MHFEIDLATAFARFSGAALFTDSRQIIVPLEDGQPTNVPAGDGSYAALHYSGRFQLNETTLREVQAGWGYFVLFENGWREEDRWEIPPTVGGLLQAVPGSGAMNWPADWPRNPRSTTAWYVERLVPFPGSSEYCNTVDLNGDGLPDLKLDGQSVCFYSIPGFTVENYWLTCLSSNQLLLAGDRCAVLPMGQSIGVMTPTNLTWSSSAFAGLTRCSFDSCYTPFDGDMGRLGDGYIGVKIPLADGDHFGWIHVFLSPKHFGPVVGAWAFEPEPGTPILTGARPYPVAVRSQGVHSSGALRALLATENGRAYHLQFRTNLQLGHWEDWEHPFTAASTNSQIDLPLTPGTGFYRVIEGN